MTTRTRLMAAGAALLVLAAGFAAEANERWHSHGPGAGAFADASANLAHTSQRGSRNAAAIRQTGAGNVARTIQHGDDNQAEIGQTGDNNRGRIIQVGDGHSAALHQDGGERSNIIQVNKGNANVDIRTGQGRPEHAGAASRRGRSGKPR